MSKKLPDSLSKGERDSALGILALIGAAIILKRKFYFKNYVERGLSCVDAAIDRGNWLVNQLPSNWYVDIYTWRSYAHTANLAYFRGSDGQFHCWIVDGYGYPVTENAVMYVSSQAEQPGDSLLDGEYNRTMAAAPGIRGVFPARCKGFARNRR